MITITLTRHSPVIVIFWAFRTLHGPHRERLTRTQTDARIFGDNRQAQRYQHRAAAMQFDMWDFHPAPHNQEGYWMKWWACDDELSGVTKKIKIWCGCLQSWVRDTHPVFRTIPLPRMDGSFELLRVQDPATDSGGGGGGYGGRDFVFFILFMFHREPLPETFAGRSSCRGETRADESPARGIYNLAQKSSSTFQPRYLYVLIR